MKVCTAFNILCMCSFGISAMAQDVDTSAYDGLADNHETLCDSCAVFTNSNVLAKKMFFSDIPVAKSSLPKHIGFSLSASPAKLLTTDKYQRLYQQSARSFAIAAQLDYAYTPADDNLYAKDYAYPVFSVGLKYCFNDITMRRPPHEAWGLAQTVDYTSHMGNNLTLYGLFSRYLFRSRRFETDMSIGMGLTYSHSKYSKSNNVDNELIGSRFLIYFTAGAHVAYYFTYNVGVFGGIDFYHHSNGALNRPNKGANIIGPVAGVRYHPFRDDIRAGHDKRLSKAYARRWYAEVSLGVGAKTLLEDWQKTQFGTSPDSARYRTGRFKLYATYSAQAGIMCRYARRWASGMGIDLFYVTYAHRIENIERTQMVANEKCRPFSTGLSAKHRAYFGNLSVVMSLGFYLCRKLGASAHDIERPIYENIGLRYAFRQLNGLEVGLNLKAHKLKADYTEVVVAYPIEFK